MLQARGLTRTFRSRRALVQAVRSVDLDVAAGEVVGFLGPNGAGKTTTLRMLTTLLPPTSGEATVAGHDLLRDPRGVRRHIGYVGQGGAAAAGARVGEELVHQARLHGIGKAEAIRRAERLLAELDLPGMSRRTVRTLSGGQRRRVDIALGLAHEPPLVFLDEPTTGLDPQSRANLWDHIRRLRHERGITVFLTTHYLEEADALCDRILVIDHGRIVAQGSPKELKRRIGGDVVTLQVEGAGDGEMARSQAAVSQLPNVSDVRIDGRTVRFTVPGGDGVVVPLLRHLDAAGVPLASVQVARPTLDDVFLEVTGRTLRDTAVAA